MFFKFRRGRAMDPLQVAMTGVRMGERYLQIFCNDAALTRGLAAKTGLSGTAALAAPDESHASRARAAANKAGAFIDVQVTAPSTWPWQADAFDMVVIDNTGGNFSDMADADRTALLNAARRVLRKGGRVELIERLRSDELSSESVLQAAGLKPVRMLAEKDGFRFIEGLNS
jgi:SAM-dependent methyltransferase